MGKIKSLFDSISLGENRRLFVNGNRMPPWSHPDQGHQFPARAHYIYKKFFIKVDVDFEFNVPQGEKEWKLWNSIQPEHRKHFVETLDCGTMKGGECWVAQPLLEQREMFHRVVHPKIIRELCKRYRITDVWLDYNWCYYRDVPIIYDYGV